MSQETLWQRAWDEAQPRLNAIQESLQSIPKPRSRVLRVGQLDAELLDQELVRLLQEPFSKALSTFNSALKARFEPELSLLIQLTLYRFSIWNTGASYGAKLQDLRYKSPATSRSLSPSGLPRRTLLVHCALTVFVPYIHARIRDHALSRAWPEAPSSDRRRKAWELLTRLETTHSVLALASFIAFLWDGRYRTTIDRLLGMRLTSARHNAKREISYEFMNRQMVWHAFTEFLIFILPMLPHRTLRRLFSAILTSLTHPLATLLAIMPKRAQILIGASPSSSGQGAIARERRGKYWNFPDTECAICHEDAALDLNLAHPGNALSQAATMTSFTEPAGSAGSAGDESIPKHPLNTPYRTTCGHTYCYVCLTGRMLRAADEQGSPWECLCCAESVRGADRVHGEVAYWTSEEGSEEEYGSDYFDQLGSSMSGISAGSRRWISGSEGDVSE